MRTSYDALPWQYSRCLTRFGHSLSVPRESFPGITLTGDKEIKSEWKPYGRAELRKDNPNRQWALAMDSKFSTETAGSFSRTEKDEHFRHLIMTIRLTEQKDRIRNWGRKLWENLLSTIVLPTFRWPRC